MKAILGQYHYAPHRRNWGVWVWTSVTETGASGTFVKDFQSKEEAREYVWKMNGWGYPKTKLNQYSVINFLTVMTAVVAVTNRDVYRAAVISQRVESDFMTGLQVAKLNELKNRMRREVVKFAFLKKSGEVRIAYGTMMPALVGEHINGRGICGDARKVCTYFDVERGEFRCFQLQSLVKIF